MRATLLLFGLLLAAGACTSFSDADPPDGKQPGPQAGGAGASGQGGQGGCPGGFCSVGGGSGGAGGAGGIKVLPSPPCSAGDVRCQVGVVQRCDKGQWVLVENCLAQPQTACEGGKCVPLPSCGNSACDPNESECTCPKDCGQPGCGECGNPACVVCGDGKCEGDESCGLCPQDCGKCCGDGKCEPVFAETKCSCPQDCGASSCGECGNPACPGCGNGKCDADETCGSCEQDCGKCCGDGKCDPQLGESKCSCAQDCGQPGCGECGNPACVVCGDGKCEAGETCGNCSNDCGPCCGNGTCEANLGELCGNCPNDCGTCGAVCGNSKVEQGEQCDGAPVDCSALGPYKPGSAPCGPACQADLSGCVLASCGNGTKDASEECDGFVPLGCNSYTNGFGGSPTCKSNCKFDLSECVYCGNDKIDPHEQCEGSQLNGATCASVVGGGATGALSCNQCQFDTSQCSIPACGSQQGLQPGASWPATGGCARRPNQSRLLGPSSAGQTSATIAATSPLNWAPQIVADASNPLLNTSAGLFLARPPYSELTAGGSLGGTRAPAMVEGGALAMGTNRYALFTITGDSAATTRTWEMQGPPSTEIVVVGSDVYFGAGNAIHRLNVASTNDPQSIYQGSNTFTGVPAYDDERGLLYVPSFTGTGYKLVAVKAATGALQWEREINGFQSEKVGCYVAVAADDTIYTACGNSVSRINPDNTSYAGGFNTSNNIRYQAPALRSDGRVLLASSDTTLSFGTVRVYDPQLNKPALPDRSLVSKLMASPLLDAANNAYLCLEDRVVSLDASNNQRWEYILPKKAAACAMAIASGGSLTVITDQHRLIIK